ncbi:unnamed protein product [Brassicogethes aeneus]|uniref:Uncharacterized protein n=1 Tax=Brassicogethes aeneus TaxID=1431903 RepID=A0A9P0FDC9_BRAAE|nr:unnamed protein product [Brassicogethes aeneus]
MEATSSTPSPTGNADSTFTSVKQELSNSNPGSPLEASSPGSIALRNNKGYDTVDLYLSSHHVLLLLHSLFFAARGKLPSESDVTTFTNNGNSIITRPQTGRVVVDETTLKCINQIE